MVLTKRKYLEEHHQLGPLYFPLQLLARICIDTLALPQIFDCFVELSAPWQGSA